MHVVTQGLFDITLGKQIEHQKRRSTGESPTLGGTLALDPDRPVIHCIEAGREIDLGGIGKGFALDCLKANMTECGIQSGPVQGQSA